MPPVHVVCALIWDESSARVLIARRPQGKRLAGMWEFPGGKVDAGEATADALHRELREELECEIEIIETLSDVSHDYPWGGIIMTPFVCRLRAGSPPPRAVEHAEIAWVPWDAIPRHDLAPADLPILGLFAPLARRA